MKPHPSSQRGMSLLELMIAMSIGLFLLLGISTVFINSNQTYADLGRASQQIENGRFAIQALSDDIALAGHYGRYSQTMTAPTGTHDPCETASMTELRKWVALHVYGYDAPASSPITACLPAANHVAGTDILVVRRADTQATASGSLVAEQVYMQANADPTNSSNPLIALGAAANFPLLNKDAATIAPIRKFHVHVYYVSPCSIPASGTTCSASADNGAPIPTLKRLELTVNPSTGDLEMYNVALVEGIENFQVDYGVDSDNDGVPNGAYVTNPASFADWMNVVAVRIHVLARNLESTAGHTDSKTYDMGVGFPSGHSPGGSYKRHVYNAVVRIVNISSRRES